MPIADLLSTAEAASELHSSARTIARWAETGELPIALKLPGATGALLFHRKDVLAKKAKLIAEADARAAALRGGDAA